MSNINVSATNASSISSLDVKGQVPVHKSEAQAETKKDTPRLEEEKSTSGAASKEEISK